MPRHLHRLLLAANIALLLGGCVERAVPVTVSSDEFLPAFAQTMCSRLVACGFLRAADIDRCAALPSMQPSLLPPLCDVARGRAVYDAAAADRCLAGLATAPCGTLYPPGDCSAVVRGAVRVGGACDQPDECAEGGSCDAGICVAVPACDPVACPPLVGIGAVCDLYSGPFCQTGLVCERAGSDTQAVCQAPGGLGAPCNVVIDGGGSLLARYVCGDGLACDVLRGAPVCAPLRQEGDPCGEADSCADDLVCEGAGVPTSARPVAAGRCRKQQALPAGSTCNDDYGPDWIPCPMFSHCLAGRCVDDVMLGGSCVDGFCSTGYCDPSSQRCAPQRCPGEPCDPANPAQCIYSSCDPTTNSCSGTPLACGS